MKLYLMLTATYVDGDGRAPFPAYLIQTDEGKNVLVDTGANDDYVSRMVNDRGLHVIVQRDDDKIANQLHHLGLSPDDIHYVICTHFDEDHCGHHALFKQAEFIVQQSHYEFALSSQDPRFAVCRSYWDVPGLRYRLINGDCEFLPGISILVTDGHVPGHQTVLVRLPHMGSVLLPSDAIRASEMLKPGVDPRAASMFDMDGDKVLTGVQKLQDVIRREHVQLVVFGHDWDAWQTFRTCPAYYD
jgi:N-acyl homoserine lactone hydrolase